MLTRKQMFFSMREMNRRVRYKFKLLLDGMNIHFIYFSSLLKHNSLAIPSVTLLQCLLRDVH